MSEPNLEKFDQLRKDNYELKRSQESIGIDIRVGQDEIARFMASIPHSNHALDVSLTKELVEAQEKDAELRERYSQVSETLKAGIELNYACEAWLKEQNIPIPDDTTGRSFSYYPR